jgi:hypothetical protein
VLIRGPFFSLFKLLTGVREWACVIRTNPQLKGIEPFVRCVIHFQLSIIHSRSASSLQNTTFSIILLSFSIRAQRVTALLIDSIKGGILSPMSTFNEIITLINAGDIAKARGGFIPQAEIRNITREVCVDTAAWTLVINEETRAALGLELESSVFSTLADGTTKEYAMTEGVKFCWKDREHVLPACVVPTADDILFGALPMEALDVYADPVDECLKGRHGDKQVYRLK